MNVFKDDESKKPIPYDQLNGNHLGHIRAMEGRAPARLREELMELLSTQESIDNLKPDEFGAPAVPARLEPALEYYYNLPPQFMSEEEDRRLQMYTYSRAKKVRIMSPQAKTQEKQFWLKEMERLEEEGFDNYLE
jgi:hypothetical protein